MFGIVNEINKMIFEKKAFILMEMKCISTFSDQRNVFNSYFLFSVSESSLNLSTFFPSETYFWTEVIK